MDSDLYLNCGTNRIFIGPTAVTVKKTKEIRKIMTEIKAKHSPYNKLSRLAGETGEEWTERYLEYIGNSNVRKENETDDEYKLRVLSPTALEDDLDYLYDVLKGLASLFDAQDNKITQDVLDENGNVIAEGTFSSVVVEEACNFIIKLLKKAKYPTTEFER